jgi:hypothetical protein
MRQEGSKARALLPAMAFAMVEQVKLPLVSLGGDALHENESVGRLPLLRFDPGDRNRDGVMYHPESVSLGTLGLRASLARK